MKSNKRNNLIIISAVVLLAIVTLVVIMVRGKKATFDQDFQIEAFGYPGAVTKIYMTDKNDHEVTLQYVNDTLWLVDGQWPASQPMVDLLAETLSEMRIRRRVNEAAAENVVTEIASRSVKVEVYYNDYRISLFRGKIRLFLYEHCEIIYVGHDTQDMMGTYMYREGDRYPYVIYLPGLRGCLSPRFIVDPYAWRSHSIVSLPVQAIASVELEIPSMPSESFVVEREGDGFVFNFLSPKTRVNGFDTARVAQLLSSFVSLNFDEFAKVVPKVELDTTFSRSPRTILRVTDTKGESHVLKTYIKYQNPDDILSMPDTAMYQVFDVDRLYAVLDDKDTVLIQYYVFDNILQPASFFLGHEKSFFAR